MDSTSDNDFEQLTVEELDSLVPRESRLFYEELEKRCKRFQPNHFIPAVTMLMRKLHKEKRYTYAPQFQVALMIEAVCAYTRGQNNDQLNWNRYATIKNLFHKRKDHALHAAIKRGIDWFILVMQREQLELQRGESVYDISNALDLYSNKQLSSEMEAKLGISPERWVSIALAIWSIARLPETIVIRPSVNTSDKDAINITEDELDYVLQKMSRTPQEIGCRYNQLRNKVQPKFHSHIRSTFIDRPFVDFGKAYCAPVTGVAFRALFSELYLVAKECSSFNPTFSTAMENVVAQTAELIPDKIKVWGNSDIEKYSIGESCDFLIETESCNLFIECKATSFTRNVVIPENIKDDGSTRKLQKAHIQIHQTCSEYLHNGIQNLLTKRGVPNIGIAITFGSVPFSNAEWYYDHFIKKHVESKVCSEKLVNFEGRSIPFSISLEVFQVLVVYLRDSGVNLLEAVQEYCSKPYAHIGEWDTFLEEKLRNSDKDSGLPFVKANSNRAFSRIAAGGRGMP